MGAILGTVAGWERDPRWTPGFRIYTGPSYLKYDIPPERLELYERWEYRVRIDITVYLCDSPNPDYPIVIREIKGILLVGIYPEEYSGGIDQWVSDVSIREAEELVSRSITEIAGLIKCNKGYDLKTYDLEEIPPAEKPEEIKEKEEKEEKIEKVEIKPKIPTYILEQIEYLEDRYREAESIDERIAIKDEIDKLKMRYNIK